jgi:hypothetical protein
VIVMVVGDSPLLRLNNEIPVLAWSALEVDILLAEAQIGRSDQMAIEAEVRLPYEA